MGREFAKECLMRLKAIGGQQIVEAAAASILSLIVDGDLRSGDLLPSQAELMEELQISRSSLHLDVCDLNSIAHPRGRVIDRPLRPACCTCPVLPPPDAISDSAVPPIAFRDNDCGIHARHSA